MKKRTYRVLAHIPIVGAIVEVHTEPYIWCTSMLEAAANGEDGGFLRMIGEYARTHPDEQITRQLVDKLRWAWLEGAKMASETRDRHEVEPVTARTDNDAEKARQEE